MACEFCRKKKPKSMVKFVSKNGELIKLVTINSKTSTLDITDCVNLLKEDFNGSFVLHINFCPMCGSQMKDSIKDLKRIRKKNENENH